jgi:NACalpha-BTF3-like transcription factor
MTPLLYSARHGNLNTVSFFVMCGVDLNRRGMQQYSNETALSLAKKFEQTRTIQELKTLTSTTVTSLGVRWSAKPTPYAIPLFWLVKFYLVFSTFYFATKPHGVLPSYDWALLLISVTSLGSYHLARSPPGRADVYTDAQVEGSGGSEGEPLLSEIVIADAQSEAVIVPRERRAAYCRYRKEWVRRHCHRCPLLNQTIGLENHMLYVIWVVIETVFLLSVLVALAFAGAVLSLAFVIAAFMFYRFYSDMKFLRMQLRVGLTKNEMSQQMQLGFEYCGKLRQHYHNVVTFGKGCGSQLGREIIEFLWRPLQTGLVLDEKAEASQAAFEQASAVAMADQIASAKRAPAAPKAAPIKPPTSVAAARSAPVDEPVNAPPKNADVTATEQGTLQGDESGLAIAEDDVQMVIEQTGVSHERATECLLATKGDLMDAILEASCG